MVRCGICEYSHILLTISLLTPHSLQGTVPNKECRKKRRAGYHYITRSPFFVYHQFVPVCTKTGGVNWLFPAVFCASTCIYKSCPTPMPRTTSRVVPAGMIINLAFGSISSTLPEIVTGKAAPKKITQQ